MRTYLSSKNTVDWRAVTVTDSIYRIFADMLTSCAEDIGLGLVRAARRSTEPSDDNTLISEIISDAIRNPRTVVMTLIDLRNVFELVNYDHLLSVTIQLGLPDDFVTIMALVDSPTGDPFVMHRTRGIKPDCPLSSFCMMYASNRSSDSLSRPEGRQDTGRMKLRTT
jgi:hypothetical protein